MDVHMLLTCLRVFNLFNPEQKLKNQMYQMGKSIYLYIFLLFYLIKANITKVYNLGLFFSHENHGCCVTYRILVW